MIAVLLKIILLSSLAGLVSLSALNTAASQMADRERIKLPLPDSEQQKALLAQSGSENDESSWVKHSVTIAKNGTLAAALNQIGVSARTTYEVNQTKNSRYLTQLRVGDTLDFWLSADHTLEKIVYPRSRTVKYQLVREADGYNISQIDLPIEIKVQTAAGTIQHSFYLSGESAGLSAKTIMNLADIFSWEIDFIRQLRPGDPFKVIYEKKYINGQYVGDGDILAAEVTTADRDLHTAFLLRDQKGENIGYYNHENRNLKKAFLKNPVDYVRITSKFKPMRYHPVLKKWRAHRGVDYAGPVGTPIHVTGDGQIIKRGWSNSYGRVIYVRHAGKFTTVYAHMSRFGKYQKGQWVKQGQIIGYIGATGLATGPHLHYEFRKSGKYVDPLRVRFPDAGPVPKKYRAQFAQFSGLMQAQMERLNPHTQLASNFE